MVVDQWVFLSYLPLTAMEPTAIRLVSLNSHSETHMTAICDARLIYGRGWISRVFICCATFRVRVPRIIFLWQSFAAILR